MSIADEFFGKSWVNFLGETLLMECLSKISAKLVEERKVKDVTPEPGFSEVFKCFRLTQPEDIKIIIPGLEPYQDSVFSGLSFGTTDPEVPPTLSNLIKEVERTHGPVTDRSLESWAEQGAFMMNLAHSAVIGKAYAHLSIWMPLAELVIKALSKKDNIVWLLFGEIIKDIQPWITNETHSILNYGYPSPLNENNSISGESCFVKCDEKLMKMNNELEWTAK